MNTIFFFSVIMCVMFYYSLDPMKCSFFLVLSLLFLSSLLSLGYHVWYSYLICLVFLSGVFVILVYFSSLSKFTYMKKPLWLMMMFFSFFVGKTGIMGLGPVVGMSEFYYDCYWLVMVYIIFSLLFFMNFVSYYISFSGAMRKL